MKIEEMNIEELQSKKKELLEEYYGIDVRKAEITQLVGSIDSRIETLSSTKEETQVNEVATEPITEEVMQGSSPLFADVPPAVDESLELTGSLFDDVPSVEPVVENTTVEVPKAEETVQFSGSLFDDVPATETVEEAKVEETVADGIQPLTGSLFDDVPSTEAVAETTVEAPVVETKAVDGIETVSGSLFDDVPSTEAVAETTVEAPVADGIQPLTGSLFDDVPATEAVAETTVVEVPKAEETATEEIQLPAVENAEQPKSETVVSVPGPQPLSQEPLTPVGIDLTEEKSIEKKTFVKIDPVETAPRAILINTSQSEKLRKSKEQNEGIVFNKAEVTDLTSQASAAETTVTSEKAVVTELAPSAPAAASKEEINKQLEAMYEELRTTTDEAKANEINNEISVLTKKLGEAA